MLCIQHGRAFGGSQYPKSNCNLNCEKHSIFSTLIFLTMNFKIKLRESLAEEGPIQSFHAC